MNLDSIVSSEVLFIISQLPFSYKKKIPKNIIIELNTSYSKEYYEELIPDKPFFEQNLSSESLLFFNSIIDNYLLF